LVLGLSLSHSPGQRHPAVPIDPGQPEAPILV